MKQMLSNQRYIPIVLGWSAGARTRDTSLTARRFTTKLLSNMATRKGFEPSISSVTGKRFKPLSYRILYGGLNGTRIRFLRVTGERVNPYTMRP